jgi:hypothetical protein
MPSTGVGTGGQAVRSLAGPKRSTTNRKSIVAVWAGESISTPPMYLPAGQAQCYKTSVRNSNYRRFVIDRHETPHLTCQRNFLSRLEFVAGPQCPVIKVASGLCVLQKTPCIKDPVIALKPKMMVDRPSHFDARPVSDKPGATTVCGSN